ncbi:odorant receptor 94b [Drosophila grimshawi]|uniref:Odorant receptor n=1 Tax=Drosophila grimshawi TaxID=7222 RepID=B4JSE8_DROGR|nr:odorant receptor 94b [Drosophila grimshawi]EDV94688.1 GH22367 [Drosophila grimshawi]
MTETESKDLISGIGALLQIQRWLGIWRWSDGNWRQLKSIYPFVLHLPLTFTYIALMWLEVIVSDDLEQAANVLYMSLTELALVVKLINIWYRGEQALNFMNALDSYAKCNLPKSEDIQFWQREQRNFKRIFYTYIGGCTAVAVTGYSGVLFQDTYELPFGFYVPFEWRRRERYFYAYGYNILAMTLCYLSNCLLDTMGCYFMYQIAVLYKLLGRRLVALRDMPENVAVPELRCIFQLHRHIRSLTKQCEVLVSPYVLAQVVLSALIICFSGYRLVQIGFQGNPGPLITIAQFVAVMILQIFLPCYCGNEVTLEANRLTNSVFNTNWLMYSVSTRKVLNCYMEFLKRPVKLRAGGFFEIGLPIFMKTINNAYSFFALLINLSK